jgi:hypothetical protein
VWLLSGAIGVLLLHLVPRTAQLTLRWAVTGWTMVACVGGAMFFAARVEKAILVTPEASEIHFVQRWRPDERPLSVRITSGLIQRTATPLEHIELRTSFRARDLTNDPALLAVRRLPAGDYRVLVDGADTARGKLSVSVGATSQLTEEWTVDAARSAQSLVIHVPVRLTSLTIRGDAEAVQGIKRLALKPERVVPVDDGEHMAIRAARYGPVRSFVLDDMFFVEPGGIWTIGDETGGMVVTSDEGESVRVAIGAGPIETRVSVAVEELTREEIYLQPGERRIVTLPAGTWRVKTTGMFRPVDYEPETRDARPLGARLEFQ